MKLLSFLAVGAFFTLPALAQNTDQPKKLDEVNINSISRQRDIKRLDSISGTYIFSGKKNEVVDLTNKDVALT
ncbi:MAG: hypothetical protein EOO88_59570, partial [Pedobacter sp.]